MTAVKEFIEQLKSEPNFLAIRQEAMANLENAKFPGRKTETWKYTRTAKLVKQAFDQGVDVPIDSPEPFDIPELDCIKMVFVNGKFMADQSDISANDDVTITNLLGHEKDYKNALDANGNIFTIINQAFFSDGLFLKVAKNKVPDKPIHVINLSGGDNTTNQVRHVINMDEGAEATVIFSNYSLDDHTQFNNVVIEGQLEPNAGLNIIKVQDENQKTYAICKERIVQRKDSRFSINTITTGGKLVRNDLEIMVEGKGCETTLNGSYITNGEQHVDNHTIVDHKVADCNSSELYKGIMDGKSTGVFNGKVFVRKDAQRINAFQSNANVLMSDFSTIYTKPELEIYADDVKCSHGSTTGQFDEDALFYLRARGLSEKSAKKILVSAFVKETVENISNEKIVKWLNGILEKKFEESK